MGESGQINAASRRAHGRPVCGRRDSDFERYKWAKDYDGYLPRLLNVPGFEGVLIHVGNYANPDSLGCILGGFNKAKGMVTDSTTTFKMLMNKYLVPASKQNTTISIKIIAQY